MRRVRHPSKFGSGAISDLQRRVPYMHPSAASIVHEWLSRACDADEQGDTRDLARLLGMVRDKIVFELRWEARATTAWPSRLCCQLAFKRPPNRLGKAAGALF
jgi:hypothetical protein